MNIGIVTTWFERGASYISRQYREALLPSHQVFIYARGGERYAQGDPNWDKEYVTWGKRVPNKLDTHVYWEDFRGWVNRNQIECVLFNEQNSWHIVLLTRSHTNLLIGALIDYYTPDTVGFFWLYDFLSCNTK